MGKDRRNLSRTMEKYKIQEIESWVQQRNLDLVHSESDDSSPFSFALVDYQEYVSDVGHFNYRRTVEKVSDASRIEDSSLFLYELQEESHQVIFHGLDIIRKSKRINVLSDENISVTQRERQLEQHISDNTTTVSLSIDDLRVGDIVDFQATEVLLRGKHPLNGKYYQSTFWLNWTCPVYQQKIRIINESSKALFIQKCVIDEGIQKLEEMQLDPKDEFVREFQNLQQLHIDEAAPSWFWSNFVQISTKISWPSLSRYLFDYYVGQGVLESERDIIQLAELELGGDVASNIVKIVRFVQNEIRYKGENHGIFTHTPKKPYSTINKRSGDCKDKSNLLVAMLMHIGVEAKMVLVNSGYGQKIERLSPSPFHFNHMIVQVIFNEKQYFFDSTIKKQSGDLEHSATLDYGSGLVLSIDGAELQKLPHDISKEVFYLKHIFDFGEGEKGKSQLMIKRTYYAHRADNMRYHFQSKEMDKLAEDFHNQAEEDIGLELIVSKPLTILKDDALGNVLETEERYEIKGLDKYKEDQIHLLTSIYLEFPLARKTGFPLRIDLDGKITHEIEVNYKSKPQQQPNKKTIKTEWFSYEDSISYQDKSLFLKASAVPIKRHVEGKDVEEYQQHVEELRLRSMNNFTYKSSSIFASVWLQIIAYIVFLVIMTYFFS